MDGFPTLLARGNWPVHAQSPADGLHLHYAIPSRHLPLCRAHHALVQQHFWGATVGNHLRTDTDSAQIARMRSHSHSRSRTSMSLSPGPCGSSCFHPFCHPTMLLPCCSPLLLLCALSLSTHLASVLPPLSLPSSSRKCRLSCSNTSLHPRLSDLTGHLGWEPRCPVRSRDPTREQVHVVMEGCYTVGDYDALVSLHRGRMQAFRS
jgi:hypothetical protein